MKKFNDFLYSLNLISEDKWNLLNGRKYKIVLVNNHYFYVEDVKEITEKRVNWLIEESGQYIIRQENIAVIYNLAKLINQEATK